MMNYAVAKWRGDDFADNRVAYDKGDATARTVGAIQNSVAQKMETFDIAKLETVFVDGMALATPGVLVGDPEFVEQILSKTVIMHG